MRSAFVSILGRPSAGKSTLINTLCGAKVSIVSPIPQTTRNTIRGILNRPEKQIVFVDTPGYHHSEKSFNLHLKGVAESSLEGIDLILYLLDTTRPPGLEEEDLAKLLLAQKIPLVVGLNKADHPRSRENKMRAWIAGRFPKTPTYALSALKEEGIEPLLTALFEAAPGSELLYPRDIYTDQEPEFRIKEIIREKAITKAQEELPHALYVEIADMEKNRNGRGQKFALGAGLPDGGAGFPKGDPGRPRGQDYQRYPLDRPERIERTLSLSDKSGSDGEGEKEMAEKSGPATGDVTLRIFVILLLLTAVGLATLLGSTPPELQCRAAILYDLETGQILYEKNADTVIPPASLAKLMSLHLAYEGNRNGTVEEGSTHPHRARIFLQNKPSPLIPNVS